MKHEITSTMSIKFTRSFLCIFSYIKQRQNIFILSTNVKMERVYRKSVASIRRIGALNGISKVLRSDKWGRLFEHACLGCLNSRIKWILGIKIDLNQVDWLGIG